MSKQGWGEIVKEKSKKEAVWEDCGGRKWRAKRKKQIG